MAPVEIGADRVKDSKNVGPVAAVVLKNVQLVPDHLLGCKQMEQMTINLHLRTPEPLLIHAGVSIRHRPDHIDNGSVFPASINPLAIVRLLVEVVDEPERRE